jgi:uncharacterized protein YeaO (DUF488 family)
MWRRALSRRKAAVDKWMKEVAPSAELRRWFGHDPAKWTEFARRRRRELSDHRQLVHELAQLASRRRVTLVTRRRTKCTVMLACWRRWCASA